MSVVKRDVFGGKKLFGDLFGSSTSFESLGYRSRAGLVGESMIGHLDASISMKIADSDKDLHISSLGSIGSVEDFRSDSESENEIDSSLTPKQQMALTIRNWCVSPDNDKRVIHEGGVSTLISLSSTDDPLVKKSCASAFYHLSTREDNRRLLVQLGAVTGVIAIAMQVRSWKVAKTVAMCLYNLSMEDHGEANMAKEGAILAVGILMGIKSQRLLPVCVHTLYNLTCVEQHYKGMDRIAKALLNVPPTAFDHTHFLIKALCNCARYSWMRLRLIEDGAVNAFLALVPQIQDRPDSTEYVRHMLICLASLSDGQDGRAQQDEKSELEQNFVASSARAIARTTGCRTDMLQRGAVDLLELLLRYCVDPLSRYYSMKVLHSLLEIVRLMTPAVFETSVTIVVDILQAMAATRSEDLVSVETRQYACSCLLIFTREHLRGIPYLFDMVIQCLPELLPKEDALTQFYAITSAGNIFEYNTCKSVRELEPLLKLVIVGGTGYRDPAVIQAVAITLAKTSTEVKYLQVMEKSELLGKLLEKLLVLVEICSYSVRQLRVAAEQQRLRERVAKLAALDSYEGGPLRRFGGTGTSTGTGTAAASAADTIHPSAPPSRPPSPPRDEFDPPSARFIAHQLMIVLDKPTVAVVRECACTAITRVALCLGPTLAKNLRAQLAKLFTEFLGCEDYSVISNTITGIRSLGERGLCEEELLSDLLFQRVAHIVSTFGASDLALKRNCCAVLWLFSYNEASHRGLAVNSVMEVLFQTTSSEDSMTRELVAATLCNISIDPLARPAMIDMGVVQVLETLSGTTSGLIQELCAKCICNLTCTEEYHKTLIDHQALQVIIMIALLRAVAPATKLLCAKALLNLTRLGNHKALEAAGSIRIFATLSGIVCSDTQHTCARGFLMISSIKGMRGDIIQRRTVVQALYSLLKSEAAQTRIMAGMAVCNLLACPSTQKASIEAGGLSVLKIIATMDYEELREATARVIITLLGTNSLHSVLAKEPLTQVLVLIAQNSKTSTFECAIKAFAFMSQSDAFRLQLIEKGCISALVSCVIAGKINTTELAQYVCRCLCLLSYYHVKAEVMVFRCSVLLALHAIYRMGFCAQSPENCAMIAIILQNFAKVKEVRAQLVEQDALKLLVNVSQFFTNDYTLTFRATISFVHGLSMERALHRHLINQGMMTMLSNVAKSTHHSGLLAEKDVQLIAMTLNSITATAACHEAMVSSGIVSIIDAVSGPLNTASTHNIVAALCQMASSKSCRQYLVDQGAADLLVKLARSSPRQDTHDVCTLALGYLSEITHLNDGIVRSFLSLSHPAESSRSADADHDADAASTGPGDLARMHSGKGVTALKKAVVGNLSSLKAKMRSAESRMASPAFVIAGAESLKSTNLGGKQGSNEQPKGRDPADSEYFTLDAEEKQLLLVNYGADQFTFIEYHASVEPGGMAPRFKINLPLPAISSSSFAESFDRTQFLPKFTVDQKCLPKNNAKLTDFLAIGSATGRSDSRDNQSDGSYSSSDSDGGSGEGLGSMKSGRRPRNRRGSTESDIGLNEPDYDEIPNLNKMMIKSKSVAGPGMRPPPKGGMAGANGKRGAHGRQSVLGAGAGATSGGGTSAMTDKQKQAADKQHKALAKFFGADPNKALGPLTRTPSSHFNVKAAQAHRKSNSNLTASGIKKADRDSSPNVSRGKTSFMMRNDG